MTYTFKMSRRLAGNHPRLVAACTALMLLAGCGAGDSSNPILVDDAGSVTLRLSGTGTQGKLQAVLSGPGGFQQQVSQAGQITGLPLGTYQIRFLPTMVDGDRWAPSVELQTILLASRDQPVAISVEYALASGSLDIRPDGIPVGAEPVIRVTGPNGYSRDMIGATLLRGLEPGAYTILANPGNAGPAVYRPAQAVTELQVTPSAAPTPVVLPYWRVVGSLDLVATGLPSGAIAQYTIAGPGNFHATRSGAAQLTALDPGTYLITASPVPFQGNTWSPTAVAIPVTVDTGTSTITVPHEIATGTLALDVEGLPQGASTPVVRISGPAGFTQDLTTSQQWVGVTPGTYHARATAFVHDGRRYAPDQGEQDITVAPSTSATRRRVKYSPETGTVAITLSGLPAGANGRVVVIGAGFADTVYASSTLANLAAGSYTLVASSISAGGTTYAPTPSSQAALVVAGEVVTTAVEYAAVAAATGNLTITLSGLPDATAYAVAVSGPNGFSQAVTATTTLSGLAPGSYAIAAANVAAGGSTYQPTPAAQSASVTAGATVTGTVAYAVPAPTTGALTITLSGLPGATAYAVAVSGPNGFSQTVTATTTLSGLAPGSYAIAAANVSAGGSTYQPTPAAQSASVTAGATVTKAVAYAVPAPTTGSLTVTLSGLPGGTAYPIAVNGPNGYSQGLSATTTLNGLAPGSYTIIAANVTAGSATYQPTPATQSASVTAGNTIGKSVVYAAQAGPATVTVDTTTRFQIMEGWEATAQAGQDEPGGAGWQASLMDQAVNDLGLNRLRLEIKSGLEGSSSYNYTPVNDNSNPNVANLAAFNFTTLDGVIDAVVNPMRARLAARGEALYVNLNYVSFNNSTPNFHATNAAEYAELMLVTFQHIQARYGWVPDAIEVILEPDNGTSWTGTMIGNAIAATGARLAAAGFHPDFIGPSTMSMAQAVPFVNQMVAVPGVLSYLSMISYHRYAGVSDANLSAIRSKAAQYNLQTAMLEHIGSGVEDLYKDLTMANVSSWQQFALAYPTVDDGAQYYLISGGQPVMASRTKQLRQYFRYVRFGAQRVAATSTSAGLRPVAFTNPGGGMAVVLHVDAAGSYTVSGIRPGTYGVELTNGAGTRTTLPNVTATGGNAVTIAPSQTGVLTLYRLP